MKTLKLNHVINCTPERFWEIFFDKEFNHWLYLDGMHFTKYETVRQSAGPDIERVVRGEPKVDLPRPVRKILGDNFGYEETGNFDAATKMWRWKMRPGTMADKMRMEGTVRIEDAGSGKCRRIAEITIEAKIFGIGKMIEKTTEKEMTTGWNDSASLMNSWISEHSA